MTRVEFWNPAKLIILPTFQNDFVESVNYKGNEAFVDFSLMRYSKLIIELIV